MKLCLFNVENFFLLSSPNPKTNIDVYKKPADKVEWIARTLTEINPDIVMLCEVGGFDSLDYFSSKYLNQTYTPLLLNGNSDRGIEMGFLVKKTFPYQFEIHSHKDEPIDFLYPHEILQNIKNADANIPDRIPSHKFSRDISELKIFKDNHLVAIIFLVHLKSKWDRDGIDYNGEMRRKAEVKALVKTYKQTSINHPNIPIIVTGDFNGLASRLATTSEFSSIYEQTDLEDVLQIINEPLERRTSFIHFLKETPDRPKSMEAFQLDYIFLPKMLHSKVNKAESGIYMFRDESNNILPTPKESYQRYALPSDHYPLVCDLDFL